MLATSNTKMVRNEYSGTILTDTPQAVPTELVMRHSSTILKANGTSLIHHTRSMHVYNTCGIVPKRNEWSMTDPYPKGPNQETMYRREEKV